MMDWITNFNSSNVAGFAWDNNTLHVQFYDGSVYKYAVDKDTYERMKRARSKGKFVWRELRGHEIR